MQLEIELMRRLFRLQINMELRKFTMIIMKCFLTLMLM